MEVGCFGLDKIKILTVFKKNNYINLSYILDG